jgi:hypothetical protein
MALSRFAHLSGQSSCPRGVNLFGMWRVQRLDQINAFNPANLFDFKSLALKIRKKPIGRFKTVLRPSGISSTGAKVRSQSTGQLLRTYCLSVRQAAMQFDQALEAKA